MNEQTQFKGFITAKILNYVCINIRIMIKFYNHQLVLLSIPHCNYKSSHYTVLWLSLRLHCTLQLHINVLVRVTMGSFHLHSR